ncbi:hypothetical protein ACLOJK_036464 [Asimina triloba]
MIALSRKEALRVSIKSLSPKRSQVAGVDVKEEALHLARTACAEGVDVGSGAVPEAANPIEAVTPKVIHDVDVEDDAPRAAIVPVQRPSVQAARRQLDFADKGRQLVQSGRYQQTRMLEGMWARLWVLGDTRGHP